MTMLWLWLGQLGRPFYLTLEGVGNFFNFTRQTFYWIVRPPWRLDRLSKEMESIGLKSIFIIFLVALFAGMVFALQTGSSFRIFGAETLVGATVGIALTRELAPVFTALMVIARAGSAMAAEIGTMQVTEQVDALKAMAVHPINYLVVPKVLASTIMVPLLTILFNGIGMLGSYLVAVHLLQIPEGPYLERYRYFVDPEDIYMGVIKAFIFGIILSLVACYKGYQTRNGAEGVGRATTQAVVLGSVLILVIDYFLASWLLRIFPDYPYQ
jgi:phospholipid/cholesterol/gamma-HCH transport system permease protein